MGRDWASGVEDEGEINSQWTSSTTGEGNSAAGRGRSVHRYYMTP